MQKEIKKRIIVLTVDFPPMPGGMAQHCYDAVVSLKLKNEEPLVVAPRVPGSTPRDDSAAEGVIRLKGVDPGRLFDHYGRTLCAYVAACARLCASGTVKAVVANTWSIAGVAALVIKKMFGVPYFVFAHGLDIDASRADKKVLWLMKLVLSEASAVIPNSSFTALTILQILPSLALKVVHPALDTHRLELSGDREPGFLRGKRVILTVARLVESKGHADVIRSLPKVIARFPDVLYCIVGEGPQSGPLRALVDELHLQEQVTFAGNVAARDLPFYYRASEVFVLTSKQVPVKGEVEGFGIVFLEAAFFGKPVIASRSGGIPDAVLDGKTGILVNPSDQDGIAAALLGLLSDKEKSAVLGQNARERVLSDFNLNRFADQLKGIIDEGLAGRK